jgi:hypothetical protein
MKKFVAFTLLLSLAMAVGCDNKKKPEPAKAPADSTAPADGTKPADTTPDNTPADANK